MCSYVSTILRFRRKLIFYFYLLSFMYTSYQKTWTQRDILFYLLSFMQTSPHKTWTWPTATNYLTHVSVVKYYVMNNLPGRRTSLSKMWDSNKMSLNIMTRFKTVRLGEVVIFFQAVFKHSCICIFHASIFWTYLV